MARKKRNQRQPSSIPQPRPLVAVEPLTPKSPDGRIRRTGNYLFKHAGETALGRLWAFVGGLLSVPTMTILVSIILYLRSPESAWAYSLLKYALIFMGGMLFPVLVLAAIASLNAYERKKKERDRVHKYTSTEKAWVDFAAEFGPAITKLRELMQEIGRETIAIAPRSQELIRAILLPDDQKRLAITSKRARALNKHCLKMEIAAERLSLARNEFFEAAEGLLKSAPSASQGNQEQLIGVRDTLRALEEGANNVIDTQKVLMQQSRGVHGKVSRDVNTSMNWLVAVCEENVRVVEEFKNRLSRTLVPDVNKKLSS